MSDAFVLLCGSGDGHKDAHLREIRRRVALGQDVEVLHRQLGYTALHAAADAKDLAVMALLLEAGASVNSRRKRTRETPLHNAVATQTGNDLSVVQFLLDAGADATLTNANGQRPLEVALEYRRLQCVELFGNPPPQVTHVTPVDVARRSAGVTFRPPPHYPLAIDGFEVELVEAGKGGRRQVRTPFKPAAMFTDVKPGTQHSVRVRAHSLVGWGDWCLPVPLATRATVPAAPTRLRVMSNVDTMLRVGWDHSKGMGSAVTGYRLQLVVSTSTPPEPAFSSVRGDATWDTYPRALTAALATVEAEPAAAAGAKPKPKPAARKGAKRRPRTSYTPVGGDPPRDFNPWRWRPYVPTKPPTGVTVEAGLRRAAGTPEVDEEEEDEEVGVGSRLQPALAGSGALIRRMGSSKGIVEGARSDSVAERLKRLSNATEEDAFAVQRRRRASSKASEGEIYLAVAAVAKPPVAGAGEESPLPDPPVLESVGSWRVHEVDVDAPGNKVSFDAGVSGSHIRMRVIPRSEVGWGHACNWVSYVVPEAVQCVEALPTALSVTFGGVQHSRGTLSPVALASYQVQYQVLPRDVPASDVGFTSPRLTGPDTEQPYEADSDSDGEHEDLGPWVGFHVDGLPPPVAVPRLLPATRYRFRHRLATVGREGAQVWPAWATACPSYFFRTADAAPDTPPNVKVATRDATSVVLSWDTPRCNGRPIMDCAVQHRLVSRPQLHDRLAMEDAHVVFQPSPWFDSQSAARQTGHALTVADPSTGDATLVAADGRRLREVWTVGDLEPGCGYEFRLRVGNAVGWSPVTPATEPFVTPALVPLKAEAPAVRRHSSTAVVVRVKLVDSSGAPLTACRLVRKKIVASGCPGESDAEADDAPLVVTRCGGSPSDGRPPRRRRRGSMVLKGGDGAPEGKEVPVPSEPIEWGREVALPPNVGWSITGGTWLWQSADKPPSQRASGETGERPRGAGVVTEWRNVVGDTNTWVDIVVGDLYPGTTHRFRVQYANAVGWGAPSTMSKRVMTGAEAPLPPPRPLLSASSASSAIVQWTQPHSNGGFITGYRIQVQRVLGHVGTAAESSDSNSDDDGVATAAAAGLPRPPPSTPKPVGQVAPRSRREAALSPPAGGGGAPPTEGTAWSDDSEDDMDEAPEVPPFEPEGVDADGRSLGKGVWRDCGEVVHPMVAREAFLGADQHGLPVVGGEHAATTTRHDGYGAEMAWTVHGLRPGTRWRFRVLACNRIGWGAPGAPSAVLRSPAVAPADLTAPPYLRPFTASLLLASWSVPRSCGARIVEYGVQVAAAGHGGLEWRDVDLLAAGNERVPSSLPWPAEAPQHRRDAPSGVPTPARWGVMDAGQASVLDARRPWVEAVMPPLAADGAFVVRVRARNRKGWCAWSAPSKPCGVLPGAPADPGAPVLLARGSTSLLVGWEKPKIPHGSALSGFTLQYRRVRARRRVAADDSDSDEDDAGDVELFEAAGVKLRPPDPSGWVDAGVHDVSKAAAVALDDVVATYSAAPGDISTWGSMVLRFAKALGSAGLNDRIKSYGWVAADLRPGAWYEFRVRAANALGAGEFVVAAKPFRTAAVPPTVPLSVTAELVEEAPSSVAVVCVAGRSNGARVDKYQVEVRGMGGGGSDSDCEEGKAGGGDGGGEWVVAATTPAKDATKPGSGGGTTGAHGALVEVVLHSLRPGAWHRVRIRCHNSAGWSPWAAAADAVQASADVPGKPDGVTVYAVTSTSMCVAWGPPRSFGAVVAGYQLERRRLRRPGDPESDGEDDDPLSPERRIFSPQARVESVQPEGWTAVLEASAVECSAAPPLPGGCKRVNPSVCDAVGAFHARGTPVASPTRAGKSMAFVVVDGLPAATTHEFRVRARNAVGYGGWSKASKPAACMAGVPDAPAHVELVGSERDPITLAWTAPNGNGAPVASYEVQAGLLARVPGESAPHVEWATVGSCYTCQHRLELRHYVELGQTAPGAATSASTMWNMVLRVRGVNEAGAGAWSRSTRPARVVPMHAHAEIIGVVEALAARPRPVRKKASSPPRRARPNPYTTSPGGGPSPPCGPPRGPPRERMSPKAPPRGESPLAGGGSPKAPVVAAREEVLLSSPPPPSTPGGAAPSPPPKAAATPQAKAAPTPPPGPPPAAVLKRRPVPPSGPPPASSRRLLAPPSPSVSPHSTSSDDDSSSDSSSVVTSSSSRPPSVCSPLPGRRFLDELNAGLTPNTAFSEPPTPEVRSAVFARLAPRAKPRPDMKTPSSASSEEEGGGGAGARPSLAESSVSAAWRGPAARDNDGATEDSDVTPVAARRGRRRPRRSRVAAPE